MNRAGRTAAAGLGVLVAACQASTTRPTFLPLPEAPSIEVRLPVPDATTALAEALRADSFPVARVEPRDGFLETEWFETPGFARPGGRVLGPRVNRVRAWINPGRPGPPPTSVVIVEVVYPAFADPSRPWRETERHVADTAALRQRVEALLRGVVERYGEPPGPPP